MALRCILLILICMNMIPAGIMAEESARYRVTFEADWSNVTHPTAYPSNAHFSGLIGATHDNDAVIWRSGELASSGIEQMAETGGKSSLLSEIAALSNAGSVENTLSGGGIASSPGTVSLEFNASRSHSLVSLVSMIAPSPDWFVGVDSLPLREDGRWIEEISTELQAYDSGTDSGVDFTSINSDTQPPVSIFHISEQPFQDQVPLGRFVFELLSTSGSLQLEGSLSGLYHDPNRVGEGINILISEIGDRRFLFLTWYTYAEGQAMWLVASNDFEPGDDSIELELLRASGTGFGPDFDNSEVDLQAWGTIVLTFPECGLLDASYNSIMPGFGSASVNLEQLVGVSGTTCK